jgi:hypothetical protein
MRAKWKRIDAAVRLPGLQARPKVGLHARGGLVPILGGLGEELHDDGGDRLRNSPHPLARGHRPSGDMAMNPLNRVRCGEGERPGEHLVQDDAQ